MARLIDLLSSVGHGARVWDYTLRQMQLFAEIATERETAKAKAGSYG